MAIDLKGMSVKELEKLKADIEKTIQLVKDRDLRAAKKAAEKAAAEFGFSLTDIADKAPAEKPKGKGARRKSTKTKAAKTTGVAKYRNPDDASQTWTGKGRQPVWFKDAIARGVDPTAMEI